MRIKPATTTGAALGILVTAANGPLSSVPILATNQDPTVTTHAIRLPASDALNLVEAILPRREFFLHRCHVRSYAFGKETSLTRPQRKSRTFGILWQPAYSRSIAL